MPEAESLINPSIILGEATRVLSENGYRVERQHSEFDLPGGQSLFAEDPYGFVALIIYPTWTDLEAGWASAQGAVVNFLSKKLPRTEPKAWEAYLLLITPVPSTDRIRHKVAEIRHDVNRLRKLVVTGDDLRVVSDVERILRPLLPIGDQSVSIGGGDLLASLPDLFAQMSIDREAARTIISAYLNDEPLLERLHHYQERL